MSPMLKVTIKGQVHSFDKDNYPLHIAIQLEEQLGMSFGAFLEQLSLGSAKAVAGFAWAVLAAEGGDDVPPLGDLLSGKFPLTMKEIGVADDDEPPDPTSPGSLSTGGSGSARSPRSSGTRPGRSAN